MRRSAWLLTLVIAGCGVAVPPSQTPAASRSPLASATPPPVATATPTPTPLAEATQLASCRAAFRLLEAAGAGAPEAVKDTLLLSCGSLEEIQELNGTGPAAPLGDDPEAWVRERCARAAVKETALGTELPPVATGPTLPSGELAQGRYETTTPGPSVMFEVTDADGSPRTSPRSASRCPASRSAVVSA